VELKLAGETTDSSNKAKSEATKLFLVTRFFFVRKLFFVMKFFFVTSLFFATGTIVPIPIPCAGLPLEAGLFCLLGGTEGVSERRCRMGFGVARNYWWQGQNAFSEK
jgi:hypothetical protein